MAGDIYSRVSGLGNRVSGTGYQVRVRVRVLNLDLTAETRDLRIKSGLRFPFELLNRFGWQVAAPGLGWREQAEGRAQRGRHGGAG